MADKYFVHNLFGVEGLNIAWYGVIIGCGILVGVLLASQEAKRQHLKSDIIFDFLFLALPIAIICARAYYVAFEWKQYSGDIIKMIAIWEGGLAIYGGVIGGFVAAVLFSKYTKFPLLRLIDMVVPSLILGQAIGRWGNFMNQEAFGNLVANPNLQFFPFAVFIERLAEWHQATFFYESMWNLCIFLILIYFRKRTKFNGQLLSIYFIGYGLGRFWIEGLRTDSLYLFPGLRISQAVSSILIISGIIMIFYQSKVLKKAPEYSGKYLNQ
ncbi:prolipoprotein diacylglyceryl transferase [Anaerosolibacter sp.]|uniref:prolipoprotein diacylglyceryl transferase n=1 Tax=Anaerosolibacter sp. TaxID=1872527 RepID=UPI0039F0FCC9